MILLFLLWLLEIFLTHTTERMDYRLADVVFIIRTITI